MNTIFLSSPKSDVVQAVGRILREKPDVRTHNPLIIDYVDTHENFGVFQRQYTKRLAFYKKMKYQIKIHKTNGEIEDVKPSKRGRKKKVEIYETECLF